MEAKFVQKIIKNWFDSEVKAVDEACQRHLKLVTGKCTTEFMTFAQELCVDAVRRGLRNPY